MENEIKVGDYIRTRNGTIHQIKDIKLYYVNDKLDFDNSYVYTEVFYQWKIYQLKEIIVKHSPNLIDLIQCGDYVNGYKVVETYKDKQLSGWQVGNLKEDETWLGVVVSSKMIKEPLQEYFDNEMIKTIVTKEQFESISYKVERKD